MAIHVVKTGDSLWSISELYNLSIQSLTNLNGLNGDKIVPGLALYIPQQELPLRNYIVKTGDTLWFLAQRFDTTVKSILLENPNINETYLYVGQQLRIPTPHRLSIQTLGYSVPYNMQDSLNNLEKVANNLSYLAVVAYSFTEEGWAYQLLQDEPLVTRSKQLGVKPLLMIRNLFETDFSPELAGRVLGNPTLRNNLINSIINIMSQRDYEGVSIDFEFIPPPQRNDFVTFLTDLKTALGNRILHVSVHAKTEDILTNPIIGAYDYLSIGQVADIVAVMTMDYGYPGGPPDPVTPLWWMAQVIRYTISLVNPRKVQIAIPLYGYSWTVPENKTSSLGVNSAQNLAISTGTVIQYDATAQAPYYTYWRGADQNIVWFEDIRSITKKYEQIDLYNLLGVTYWQLAFEFPQNWSYLGRDIKVIK